MMQTLTFSNGVWLKALKMSERGGKTVFELISDETKSSRRLNDGDLSSSSKAFTQDGSESSKRRERREEGAVVALFEISFMGGCSLVTSSGAIRCRLAGLGFHFTYSPSDAWDAWDASGGVALLKNEVILVL